MSELKREKRLNKNGVLVTKLVRDIDKNGVAISKLSTVAPKLDGKSQAKSASPVPSSPPWNPLSALKERRERKAHERKQRDYLRESLAFYVGADEASAETLVMSIHKPENVDKALALVAQFEEFGGRVGDSAVKDLLRTVDMDRVLEGESSGLRAMYAHREYFERNPSSVGMFAMGIVFLKERGLDHQQDDGVVPPIEKIVDSAYELARAELNSGRNNVDVSDFFTKATMAAGLKQRAARGK
jgi:hypothetical protein